MPGIYVHPERIRPKLKEENLSDNNLGKSYIESYIEMDEETRLGQYYNQLSGYQYSIDEHKNHIHLNSRSQASSFSPRQCIKN